MAYLGDWLDTEDQPRRGLHEDWDPSEHNGRAFEDGRLVLAILIGPSATFPSETGQVAPHWHGCVNNGCAEHAPQGRFGCGACTKEFEKQGCVNNIQREWRRTIFLTDKESDYEEYYKCLHEGQQIRSDAEYDVDPSRQYERHVRLGELNRYMRAHRASAKFADYRRNSRAFSRALYEHLLNCSLAQRIELVSESEFSTLYSEAGAWTAIYEPGYDAPNPDARQVEVLHHFMFTRQAYAFLFVLSVLNERGAALGMSLILPPPPIVDMILRKLAWEYLGPQYHTGSLLQGEPLVSDSE